MSRVSFKRSRLAWSRVELLHSLKYSILIGGSPISIRITALVPNTKLNRNSLVDARGVVWYAYNILDSLSTHVPLDSSNFILSPYRIVLLVTYDSLFNYECPTVVNHDSYGDRYRTI